MDTQTLPLLASRPSHREMRVRFTTREALLSGLARAQREPWVDSCTVDLPNGELVMQLAGGFRQTTAPTLPH